MSSQAPTEEPGGQGQALPAAGLLAVCAASQSPDCVWLRAYLKRVLSPPSSIQIHSGARNALIEQAVEIASADNAAKAALEASDGYLSASAFGQGHAVPLVAAFLQADVISSTSYDARAREALMRFVGALHLPPRILYQAESDLAALVHDVEANAKRENGKNIESVEEDADELRRRKNMKWLKIGTASVVSGIALGLSGGLIAPALLPALGTVGLAGVSAPLAALGGGGAVAVGGLFGAAGAGVGAAAMSSRAGDVEEFTFEPCSALGGSEKGKSRWSDVVKVTPRKKLHEVFVPSNNQDASEAVIGGLLVWELLTWQEHPMIVPGGISFGVQFREFANDGEGKTTPSWLLPEEQMDAGGLDKGGVGRKRRTTGAVTVQGNGMYVLSFRLMPGSLPVNVSYRVALVPPGKDPPVWIMEENEHQPQEIVTGSARSLSLAILVPGLATSGVTATRPGMFADQFALTAQELSKYEIQALALRWDSNLLVELSSALRHLVGKMAVSAAAQNGAMMIVPALVGAMALPVSIIGALRSIIGNVWAKTLSRASECGFMLAAELASRSFGNRPVSLAGYSAGATVVFSCLQELARRELLGIVHDVCLVGAPCSADVRSWEQIRSVVSGRLINAYNPNDWYLEIYTKSTNLVAVAGTRAIQDVHGRANVENIRLTPEQVGTHMDYAKCAGRILLDVGFGDAEHRRPWLKTGDLTEEFGEGRDKCEPVTDSTDENLFEGADDPEDEIVIFKAGKRPDASSPERSKTG